MKQLIRKIKENLKAWFDYVEERNDAYQTLIDQLSLPGCFVCGAIQGFKQLLLVMGAVYWVYSVIAAIKGKDMKVEMVDRPRK